MNNIYNNEHELGDNSLKVYALFYLLHKLELAGLQKRSIPFSTHIAGNARPISRFAIRCATISLTLEYYTGCRYTNCDPGLFP